MKELIEQIKSYGLTPETYERCLREIKTMGGRANHEWTEITEKYGINLHHDTLRKASQTIFGGAFVADYMRNKNAEIDAADNYLGQLRMEKQELRKERQKTQDERIELQRLLREQARKESFVDLIKRKMSETIEPIANMPSPRIESDDDMVICLSDVHAGIQVNNSFNKYDTKEMAGRFAKYFTEIAAIQKTHKCKEAFLVLGGDMISGLIHPNLRLQNNENVIEQLKTVSVYIGEFVKSLAGAFEKISIMSVSGNHSRLTPQKEQHLHGEELDALVPFHLKLMFKDCNNVAFLENGIDDTIASFTTRGDKLFYAVHGDKDSPRTVAKNLTLMTGQKPDCILLGHRHHNTLGSEHGIKIISNGSLVGTDNYCLDMRITGRAEQCVIITNKNSTVKCLYDVGLSEVSND